MSIDELVEGIGGSRETVQRAVTEVLAAKAKAEELSAQFVGLSAVSMVASMTEVASQLDTAHQTLTSVADGLEQTQATAAGARQHGGGLLGGGNPGSTSVPVARPTFKPMRTDPAKVEEVRPYVGEPIAYATLWDSEGRQVVGIHNADDGGPAKDAKWAAPWGEYPRLRRHVEAHAAARMRRGDKMAMHINMPPCSYPDGCEQNLRDILPEGPTLIVHQVHSDGRSASHRTRGRGERTVTNFADIATPVTAPTVVADRLIELFEDATDARELAQIATADGVTSPDDRPDWTIVGAYAPGADEPALFWVNPADQQLYPTD